MNSLNTGGAVGHGVVVVAAAYTAVMMRPRSGKIAEQSAEGLGRRGVAATNGGR
jgi:hypothetical protein